MGLWDFKANNGIGLENKLNKLKIEKSTFFCTSMEVCANAVEALAIFIDGLNSIFLVPHAETTCYSEHDNGCGELKYCRKKKHQQT